MLFPHRDTRSLVDKTSYKGYVTFASTLRSAANDECAVQRLGKEVYGSIGELEKDGLDQ
jgi:hypothetical protein